AGPRPRVLQHARPRPTGIPPAGRSAPDGTVWFTIEFSDAIGRLRNGRVETLPKGKQNIEPIGLAVDAAGAAWFTDGPARAISRMAPDGVITSFTLSTPIARLARLAVGPDGSVWFAEGTAFSVTRLKDGVFTRHEVGSIVATPFGVAVDRDGAAWATVQSSNKLVHITPGGQISEWEPPTRAAGLGDVAVDGTGGVWFLELRANRIGRFAAGRF